MKKTFYEKVGRRYIPVSEYDQTYLDSFPKGNHLVMVYPGGSSRRYNIDPNYAAMIAAGRVAEDAVTRAVVKSQELRPQTKPLTEEQQALWRALAHSFNRDEYPLLRPCAADAGRAAVDAMMVEAEKLMEHPTVRKAFDKFLMICELVKKNETNN
jgi:hypothetical protein